MESFESIPAPKEKLRELEETGKFVFHGSPDGEIKILEPRQGKYIPNLEKPEEIILDGEPAVSATPYADVAIFRAIINGTNIQGDYSSGFHATKDRKEFRVSSEEVLGKAQNKHGFVYVFDKDQFKPYDRKGNPKEDSYEWRSYTEAQPIEAIEVTADDLPSKEMIIIAEKW